MKLYRFGMCYSKLNFPVYPVSYSSFKKLMITFWLHWAFVTVRWLLAAMASLLCSTGSGCTGLSGCSTQRSMVAACGCSCPIAGSIFLDQGFQGRLSTTEPPGKPPAILPILQNSIAWWFLQAYRWHEGWNFVILV